jgi:hypothetical protein
MLVRVEEPTILRGHTFAPSPATTLNRNARLLTLRGVANIGMALDPHGMFN